MPINRRSFAAGLTSIIAAPSIAHAFGIGKMGARGGFGSLGVLGTPPYLGKGTVGARIRQAMNSGALSGFSGYSWHIVQEVPTAFTAIRLVFFNTTGLAIPIDRCIVGQTNSVAGGSQLVPTGTGAAWANVTFDGGNLNGTIPANNLSNPTANPLYYFSDWISLASIARTDGGTFPVVMARCYLSTTNPLPNMSTGVTVRPAWQTEASDLEWYNWHFKQGDFVSSNTAGFVSTSDPGQAPIIGVQYTSSVAAHTVALFGDSNARGQQATADGNSWFSRTCEQLNTNGIPVFYENFGWGGQTIQQYYTRWQQWLSQAKQRGGMPSIAVFPVGTSNGWFAGASTTNEGVVQSFLADCQANRIRPVLVTMLPKNSYTVSEDNDRKTLNTWALGLASSRINVIDADSAVSDGGSPAQFQAGMAYTDGIHLVDQGHAAVKSVALPILQALAA